MKRGEKKLLLVLLALFLLGSARRTPGPRMSQFLSLEQLRDLARSAGFEGEAVNVAAAVAMAESGGDVWAQGDPRSLSSPDPSPSSNSFGLWQIHVPSHPQYRPASLLTAEYNAHAAHLISKGGTDWSPWSAYRSGAYYKFMPPFSS